MLFKQFCSNPCFLRGVSRLSTSAAVKTSAAAKSFCNMASESAARRRLASTYIFGCSAEPMLGARFVTVESERLRPSVSMEKPAATAVESCDNGSANGSLTCTGEEDDTEGTERSRTAHRTSVTTDAKDASQTKPILKNGAKEFGNVYKMHEPTMFGDWSHMGRVSDF